MVKKIIGRTDRDRPSIIANAIVVALLSRSVPVQSSYKPHIQPAITAFLFLDVKRGELFELK